MKWTLINPAGTNDPDTGDIYSGLDRFGRVKDNRWLDGAGDDLDRLQYGYDRASNRIWRRNVVAAALGKEFDELYGYDGIHRLQDMARGTLNGSRSALTSETFAQCWTLDSTGNWQGFREDDTGNGTWDLVQQRSANAVNEISGITETTGPSWVTPAYSRAGNMTTLPQPADPTESYTATYDAWNRLVKIADGSDTVSEYAYDGAKRRIVQKSYTGGVLDETRHLYYTQPSSWQALEERVGTSPDSADAERQFVWGERYVDDLVLRDRDTDDNGTLNERLYALQDANWNVTGIVNDAGDVQERSAYEAYGTPVCLSSAFVPQANAFDWETIYCGYRYEAATGLCHVRHRAYLPDIASWLERDSLGFLTFPNLYLYVDAKPTIATDASGQQLEFAFINVPSTRICAFTMNDTLSDNQRWNNTMEDYRDSLIGPGIYDISVFPFPNVMNPWLIPALIRKNRCCEAVLFGHQGGLLGNYGGITTRDPSGDRIVVLPDPALEAALRNAFSANRCSSCTIKLYACGSCDPRVAETQLNLANATGCNVCGTRKAISLGILDGWGDLQDPPTLECTSSGDMPHYCP